MSTGTTADDLEWPSDNISVADGQQNWKPDSLHEYTVSQKGTFFVFAITKLNVNRFL